MHSNDCALKRALSASKQSVKEKESAAKQRDSPLCFELAHFGKHANDRHLDEHEPPHNRQSRTRETQALKLKLNWGQGRYTFGCSETCFITLNQGL